MDLLQFVQVALNATLQQKVKEWPVCLNRKKMEMQEVYSLNVQLRLFKRLQVFVGSGQ